MCAVSAIYDYGRSFPFDAWNKELLAEYQRLLDQAKTFDTNTGQSDCEDPEKMKFIQAVEEKLSK